MNKNQYQAKLDKTVITDENTVAELRAARKVEASLTRFWKKAALAYIKQEHGDDLVARKANWISWTFDFNLKPTGTIKVQVYNDDDMPNRSTPAQLYTVPKARLLAQ